MSTAELRLNLIQRITEADETTLQQVLVLMEEKEEDWWNQLSAADKESIQKGIKQAKAGDTVSHEEAMKVFEK